MRSLLVILLLTPGLAEAFCEREEALYANSVNLHVSTSTIHENNKRLFEAKKISLEQMAKSYELFQKTFGK